MASGSRTWYLFTFPAPGSPAASGWKVIKSSRAHTCRNPWVRQSHWACSQHRSHTGRVQGQAGWPPTPHAPQPGSLLQEQPRGSPGGPTKSVLLAFRSAVHRPCDLGETCFPGSQASSLQNGDRGTWQHPLGGRQGAEGMLSREVGREPGEGSCCFPGAEAVQDPETQKGPLLGAPAGHRVRAGRKGERHADLCLPGLPCPAHTSDKPRQCCR